MSPGRTDFLVSLSLAALTLAAYGEVCTHDFVNYDDQVYVTENSHVKEGLTAESLKWALTSFECSNWHPLTWLSLQLDFQLYGLRPAGYHLTNLLLHAGNVVLVFLV